MVDFIVYTNPISPFARAVLAVLEEKGERYSLVGIPQGGAKKEPHILRHPFGKMPAFEHAGFKLYETQAILRYLDRVLPSPPMTPTEPKRAARMDQVLNICDWYLFQNVVNTIAYERIVRPKFYGEQPDMAVIESNMPRATLIFTELGRLLGEQTYFSGAEISLADFMTASLADILAPLPEWAAMVEGSGNLSAWFERMAARPSMQATTYERAMAMTV